ncbi:hypothetical protein Bca4012_055844 [Brassica carinata]
MVTQANFLLIFTCSKTEDKIVVTTKRKKKLKTLNQRKTMINTKSKGEKRPPSNLREK